MDRDTIRDGPYIDQGEHAYMASKKQKIKIKFNIYVFLDLQN
jgi:hypothetical protein